jgi:hypothetical protein
MLRELTDKPTPVAVLPPAAYLPDRMVALELETGEFLVAPQEFTFHTDYERALRAVMPEYAPVPFHAHWWTEDKEWKHHA